MRFLKLVAMVAAVVGFSVQSAHATVFGSAVFSTTSMNVQRSATQFGVFSDVGAGGALITSSTLTVVNTANLDGFPQDQEIGFFPAPAPVADTLQAFVTSGAEVAPGENTFSRTVPVPATSAFSRSDALTTGNLLSVGGLDTHTVAEIEAGDLSTGFSTSSTSGSSTFILTVAQSGWYRLQFDAFLDLVASSVGPPANRVAQASSSLTIQLNTSDLSLDAPIAALTKTITGDDGFGPQNFSGVTTSAVFLAANTAHTLTIGQKADVSLRAVPEPTSMAVFAGAMVVGGLGLRRRKAAK